MSSRLLFLTILGLIMSICLAKDISCYQMDDQQKEKPAEPCPGKWACCMKASKEGKTIAKGCFDKDMCKSLNYGCRTYDRKKHGSIRDSGKIPPFKDSTICLCSGDLCNDAKSAPFAAAAVLALIAV